MLYFEKTATVFPNKTAYLLRDGARIVGNENKGGKMKAKHQVRHIRKRGNKLYVAGKRKAVLTRDGKTCAFDGTRIHFYDGALGYEAAYCPKCGRYADSSNVVRQDVFFKNLLGGKMKAFGQEVVGVCGGRQMFLVPWKQKKERVFVLKDGRKVRTAKIVYYPRGLSEAKKK